MARFAASKTVICQYIAAMPIFPWQIDAQKELRFKLIA
jgi:hypothetical protein